MSISAISSAAPVQQAEVQKPVVTAPAIASTPTATPAATVSISAAGHEAASSGDVDHDGDSH